MRASRELVGAGDRECAIGKWIRRRAADPVVEFVGDPELDRAVVVGGSGADGVAVRAQQPRVACVLEGGVEARNRRGVVADRLPQPVVESAGLRRAQETLRPQRRRREDRARQRRDVAEDRQDVVVGPEEVAHLEAAERPVKAHERVAAGEDAGALGHRYAVLDLENRGNPVAEGFSPAYSEFRRVGGDAVDVRVGTLVGTARTRLLAVDHLQGDIEAAVQRDACILRTRDRRVQQAGDDDGDKLRSQGYSPLAHDIAVAARDRNPRFNMRCIRREENKNGRPKAPVCRAFPARAGCATPSIRSCGTCPSRSR